MIGWVALGLAAWALARRDQDRAQRAELDSAGPVRVEAFQLETPQGVVTLPGGLTDEVRDQVRRGQWPLA